MVSVSVCYLFYQPMDGKNKTWTLRFPTKENPNMEKALFDWPIVLQYDVKAISRKFFGHEVCLPERSLSQPKAGCVCIRSIHQSNRSISVRLLFLFCSRVFISRSYENRSNQIWVVWLVVPRGKCTLWIAQPGQLGHGETIRACASAILDNEHERALYKRSLNLI